MGKRDGFDVAAGGDKVGSFQTGLQDDGTREMYVFGPGVKLHFGAAVVEGVLGKSFARASNTSGANKAHAGPGIVRGERSTEALATFVVEEQAPRGPKVLRFTQGRYQTAPVVAPDLPPVRDVRNLPWPDGCRRAEYGVSVYDTKSKLTPGTTQTTIEYSSASTGFGVAITLKRTEDW
jgi:hypothetical protein